MGKTIRAKHNHQKKMKTMRECAGLPNIRKFSTATVGRSGALYNNLSVVERSDGSISKDKTAKLHSHPGAKEKARNANRSQTKAARQALKRDLNEQRAETSNSS